ncbi:FGGY family carbohydrate kinase [Phytohabitans kaempferiae]|uniref:FGGY family carbohydrate kinase n=1 Tax=Phytohabitans kaempferiae TaxID=1620943 RepID=A0ABV6LZB2_9ACTN
MTDDPLVLGLDLGSSRLKAVLVGRDGRTVLTHAVPTPFVAADGGAQMTPRTLFAAVGELLAGLGGMRARVAGVGVASMGECGAFVAGGGAVEEPMPAWYDARGADTAEALRRHFGPDLDRRIGRPLRAATTVAKLGWLREHGYRADGDWLGVAALVAWRLTGARAGEPSLAATTGAFDPVERRYLPEVLAAAGLDGVRFAKPRTAGERVGEVIPAGAAWSGLPPGVPVTLAGHDHLVGAIGAGAGPDDLVDSMGTGEPVVAFLAADAVDRDKILDRGLTLSCRPGGDRVAVMYESLLPGRVLARLAALLGAGPAEMDARALAWPDTIPDPFVEALVDDPDAALGAVPPLPPERLWAGALAVLARRAADAVDVLRLAGARTDRMVLIGGGTASGAWLAAKRRAVAMPLVRAHTAEAVARGAALFGGVAGGWWPAAEAAPSPEVSSV